MGERSITKLTIGTETRRLYLHWGSPEFQVVNFADFTYWTWSTSRPWDFATWDEFLAGIGDRLLPDEESDGIHGDLEHYYRITIGTDGTLSYTYRHRRLEHGGWQDWQTQLEAHSRLELYQAAADQLATRRAWTEREARQRPDDTYLQGHLHRIGILSETARLWTDIEQIDRVAASASLTSFHDGHACGLDQPCSFWRETFGEVWTHWNDPNAPADPDSTT
ncbi:hypothetical protein [Glycomyces harbinensis]|uniref:Uncharacterized protein n=1 Tax=Glycomyces harbinensis TaxID=58114 RepID=A0A1G6YA90_9ACTN|nr:hypothetical protein [Glycomyces harbinensis]SDD87280.1 hypothetical protein SAMN05216270_108223 [Glycomyces harbinensis]